MARADNLKVTAKLSFVAALMFVFAFWVMPPLYDAFCEITGLNSKSLTEAFDGSVTVDDSREIKVQFLASNNGSMPWDFSPETHTVVVSPGEEVIINYLARNPTDKPMVARAVPSMMPLNATAYFHKTECFCFNEQPLAAGASAKLGLSFIVDSDLPKNVNSIILSYTLFDITDTLKETDNNKQNDQVGAVISR